MDTEMIFASIAAERLAVADLLDSLDPAALATQSLCGRWTVRTVGAHLAVASKPSATEFGVQLARRFGNFNRANDDVAQAMARRSTQDIIGLIRKQATSRFTPPGHGAKAPLTDVLIHSGDIRRPLGLPHEPEPERVAVALELLSARNTFGFAPFGILKGIRVEPVDLADTFGDPTGVALNGRAIDITMAIAGRAAAADLISGPGAELLLSRL